MSANSKPMLWGAVAMPGWRAHFPLLAVKLLCFSLLAQAAPADECSTLVDEAAADWHLGKMASVIAALQPAEVRCAGHARFNRVLGEALLAGGDPVDALMPLERAVRLHPDDKGAFTALKQAWRVLELREQAYAAFNPRAEGADGAAAENGHLRWQLMLEGSRGHDSNANLSTADHSITVPGLNGLNITLDQASRQQASEYWGDAMFAGGIWTPLPDLQLRADVADTRRVYSQLPAASTENRSGALKIERTGSWGNAALGAQSDWLQQGGGLVRIAQGGNLSWQPPSKSWPQFELDAVDYRYVGNLQGTDGFIEEVLSANHGFAFKRAQLGWTLLAGHDRATVFRADGDRDLYGLRLSAEGAFPGQLRWFVGYDHISGRYASPNPAFQVVRSDGLDSLTGELSWLAWKELSVRAQLVLARQHSNIPLYDYRRADVGLTLSYLFGN